MSAGHDFLKITRRQVMELSGTLLAAAIYPAEALSQSAGFSTLVVMIDDVDSDINPLFLNDILSEFFRRNIPVTCVVDLAALKPMQSDDLFAQINATLKREVGLFEIGLAIGPETDERRYFQMRAAESLRAAAQVFASDPGHPIASIIDRESKDWIDLSAYRSAGFKVLVRPQQPGPAAAEFVGRRQLRLLGGVVLRLADPDAASLAQVSDSLAAGADARLVLSLSGLTGQNAAGILAQVSDIATLIEASVASGSVFATRPMDYLLQFGPRQPLELALVVGVEGTAGETAAARLFVEALGKASLPVTVTGTTRPAWMTGHSAFCPVWSGGGATSFVDPDDLPDAVLVFGPAAEVDLPSVPVPVPVIVVGSGQHGAWNGLRADGRMQLALSNWEEVGLSGGTTQDRHAVLVGPADIAMPRQREAVLRQIQTAQQTGRVLFHTIASLAHDLLAPEPVLTRFWATRKRQVTDPPRREILPKSERAQMLDDARLAWRFIDRFTHPLTGLCAGTVQAGPSMRINREVTLWDLASQMQGIIAAVALKIIPLRDGKKRLATMLANMPVTRLDGHNLPPAMFLTDTSKAIVTPGFDICDTGRFLIALHAATAAGLVTDKMAQATLRIWDLDAAVQDGHPFNHDGIAWVDGAQSHCTPYIGRAFADIGLPMDNPYGPDRSGMVTDDKIRLLYAASFIGSYGTEPLLLDAVEQGASAPSAFLADVLFDAQLTWFEETGQLKCVSESPLNRPPWFLFQGLRVDRLGAEAWTIKSMDRSEDFQTETFQREAEVISTKSAYLWAATHPHPYSDRLIRLIRNKARIDDFGFSVGIFSRSMAPMENYSDLNTNGIILTAIASILGRV